MKRITLILMSLVLLLSTLLQGCDDDMTGESQTEETQKQEEPMTPVEPFRADSGDYVYDAANTLRNNLIPVCDCRPEIDIHWDPVGKYCPKVSKPSVESRTYIDETYKNKTDIDIYGNVIPLEYKESVAYSDGSIRHNYNNATLDDNGKIHFLYYKSPDDVQEKESISEEEAGNIIVSFLKDYTYVTDLSDWEIGSIELYDSGSSYSAYVYRTFGGIRTCEYVYVKVNAYTKAVTNFKATNRELFSGVSLSVSYDKESIEQKIYEIVNATLDEIVEYYDEPYYLSFWEEINGEYKNDNITGGDSGELGDDYDDNGYPYEEEDKFYTANFSVNRETAVFEYELRVFNDGTPYISIVADLDFIVTETNWKGRVVFSERYTGHTYNYCIFPDGSAVVQAWQQEAAEKQDGSQAQ